MKECYQHKVSQSTPCFIKAGRLPCSNDDCLVAKKIGEFSLLDEKPGLIVKLLNIIFYIVHIQKKPLEHGISADLLNLMLHSTCRMSLLSEDNQEFKTRVKHTHS